MTERNETPCADSRLDAGQRLRQAREQAGLDLARASAATHLPVRVLEALERGDWGALGAPVFVRGQLRSYARLLGVDVSGLLADAGVAPVRPVELVSHSYTPRYRHVLESVGRRSVYVVITLCFFAVPLWLATHGQAPQQSAALDVAPQPLPQTAAPAVPAAPVTASPELAPITASMTPRIGAPAAPAASSAGLSLNFTGESWVEVRDAQGNMLERRLFEAGEQRSFEPGQAARVVLGNAGAVQVQQAGNTVDLSPYQRANVARFAVSSEGSLAPVQD
ncbi:MAG: DUF4115 domain-containing protein [Pseudoxanthomonas sp.]